MKTKGEIMSDKNNCGCSCDCGCSPEEAAVCAPKEKPNRLGGGTPMDTQIFRLNLGVLPTSVYIIIAALQADNVKPSLSAIASRWNEKPQALEEALTELQGLNIIVRHQGQTEKDPIYLVNPADLWAANNQD